MKKGETFALIRTRTITNKDTGERHTVEHAKRIKQWWFTDTEGMLCFQVRYGAMVIELSKGKNAIELASNEEFIPTLNLIKQAVERGELDKKLETKSTNLRLNLKSLAWIGEKRQLKRSIGLSKCTVFTKYAGKNCTF